MLNEVDDKLGLTPATFAMINGNYEVLEMLRGNGANVFQAGEVRKDSCE